MSMMHMLICVASVVFIPERNTYSPHSQAGFPIPLPNPIDKGNGEEEKEPREKLKGRGKESWTADKRDSEYEKPVMKLDSSSDRRKWRRIFRPTDRQGGNAVDVQLEVHDFLTRRQDRPGNESSKGLKLR